LQKIFFSSLLKDKWDVSDPEQPNSLSNFVKKQVKIPERADYRDIWERVICPQYV
jgi:hypothetical protein